MSSQTLYDLLAVPADADTETIRSSYRRLAKTYHPDVAGDAGTVMMQKINEAWDILKDDDRRREYDLTIAPAEATTPADDLLVDPEYADAFATDAEGRLAYDARAHRIWTLTRRIAVAALLIAVVFFVVSVTFFTGDLAGNAPLRGFAVPSMLVLGFVTLSTVRTTFWNFPFRAGFALFCLTGPLAFTHFIPFEFLAMNFHWWECVAVSTVFASMVVYKQATRVSRRYRDTAALIP